MASFPRSSPLRPTYEPESLPFRTDTVSLSIGNYGSYRTRIEDPRGGTDHVRHALPYVRPYVQTDVGGAGGRRLPTNDATKGAEETHGKMARWENKEVDTTMESVEDRSTFDRGGFGDTTLHWKP